VRQWPAEASRSTPIINLMAGFQGVRTVAAFVLVACIAGCSSGLPAAHHSDQDLWMLWNAARQNIARQIDLNFSAPSITLPLIRARETHAPSRCNRLNLTWPSNRMSARQNLWRKRACHSPIPPACSRARSPAMSVTQQRTHSMGRNSHVRPLHGKMREKTSQKFCNMSEDQILATLGYSLRWR